VLRFEWDDVKALVNERKHGVSFEEALKAFDDDRALEASDEEHSSTEQRFYRIGHSGRRLLLIVFTEREGAI